MQFDVSTLVCKLYTRGTPAHDLAFLESCRVGVQDYILFLVSVAKEVASLGSGSELLGALESLWSLAVASSLLGPNLSENGVGIK